MSGPFFIAEMGASHNGSLDTALAIVAAAAKAGAYAIKVQTFIPGEMAFPGVHLEHGPWAGRDLHELYGTAALPWEWHAPIFARAKELGLVALSSPFSAGAVHKLEQIGCQAYKIASPEIGYESLIRAAATTLKPVIISTGSAYLFEVERAAQWASDSGCFDLTLLHCVSSYPALPDDYNLSSLRRLQQRFPFTSVGLSDHTKSNTIAIAATAIGVNVIERHITLGGRGLDDVFASTPDEFADMVQQCRAVLRADDKMPFTFSASEMRNREYRRSLWVIADLPAGHVLARDDIGILRPDHGMSPEELPYVVGGRLVRDVQAGSPLTHDLVWRA